MMKHLLTTLCWVAIGVDCFLCAALYAQTTPEDHRIVSELRRTTYVFGDPIQVTVRYENNGTAEWRLCKPDESILTEIHLAGAGNPEKSGWRTMNELQVHVIPGTGREILTIPEPQNIVIRLGEAYSFTSEMFRCIFPGRWVLWTKDMSEGIGSKTLSFQVVFTKESAGILLEMAKNTEEEPYVRKQYVKYLREIRPTMPEFAWPRHDDSPEEKSRKEALIQRHLREFEDFWKRERDSPDVRKAIERINKVCRELTESRSIKDCPDILEFRR